MRRDHSTRVRVKRLWSALGLALLVCGWWGVYRLQASGQAVSGGVETATEDRMSDPQWWPTKGDAPRSAYAGSKACAQCHAALAGTQATTPMAGAGRHATDAESVRRYMPLLLTAGAYCYTIASSQDAVTYTVMHGAENASVPLAWAFGSGELGQTYVYEQHGAWSESRVSLYTKPGALDITTGHSHLSPESLTSALGRPMSDAGARRCFGCHTTAATTDGQFRPQLATPGITCEGCHGPGAQHLANMQASGAQTAIANLAHLSAVDSVDFCGSCHRTWADIAFSDAGKRGLEVVRFQPYRLEKSKCWGTNGDARITCVACHNPHQPLERSAAAYDVKCLGCHVMRGQDVSAAKPGKACPQSSDRCTTCHMPKYTLTEMHGEFTDHLIRIVRQGELFPE